MIISKLHILILLIVACTLLNILFRYQYSSIIFHHRLLSLINPSINNNNNNNNNNNHNNNNIKYNHDAYKINDHIPYQVRSNNVELKCQYRGYPICCLLLDNPSIGNNTDDISHQVSNITTHESNNANKNKNDDQIIININSFSIKPVETTTICSVHKKYISSPYEVRHYEKSVELSSIDDDWMKRRDLLSDFIIDDIPHANKWLRRVHVRMKSPDDDGVIDDTSEDYEYLSRFEVTKTCTTTTSSSSSSSSTSKSKAAAAAVMNNDDHIVPHQQAQSTSHLHSTEPISSSSSSSSSSSTTTMTWNEWIEPLSIHARHPFSYIECRKETFYEPIKYFIDYIYQSASKMEFKSKLTGVDYILLQSEASLQNHTKSTSPQWSKYDDSSTTHGLTYSNSDKHSSRREAQEQRHHHPLRRNYMLDAGM